MLLASIARPHLKVPVTRTYDQVILADSPIAWWKADETSGTVMHDSSGNGHDATYNAGVVALNQTPLRSGSTGCIGMSTTSYGASISSSGLTLSGTNFTLEAIVNKTGGGSTLAAFFGYDGSTNNIPERPGIVYRYNSQLRAGGSFDSLKVQSPNDTAGTTVIMQMTYNLAGQLGSFYENGVLVATLGSIIGFASAGSTIVFAGAQAFVASYGFIGRCSDFAIYRSELSAARCLAHAQAAGLA